MRPMRGEGFPHHRLLGLDRRQRLIDDHMVSFGDMPGDELRLPQPLRPVREVDGSDP